MKHSEWVQKHCAFAQTQGILPEKVRRAVNGKLYDLSKKYWPSIPLPEIGTILAEHHIRLAEEFILTGRDGRDTFDLTINGIPVSNSMLVLTWHKMESTNNWEIVAYLS